MSKVIWFTGISGAGKSTLGKRTVEYLQQRYGKVEFLDGNEVRDFFDGDLGFSEEDRFAVTKRIVYGAYLLSRNGIPVVVTNIAGRYSVRDYIRKKLGEHYVQIYLSASVEQVSKREVRDLYKEYQKGELQNLVGVDMEYDVPRNPDLMLNTDEELVEESFAKVKELLDSVL